jgi:prepilin-type N-terminal cleavage/methylation domain-containing protein/prepilin-type processing-associated H-X9-DG protein
MKRVPSHAFTLVEILVVIAIIGVMISLLLPAIQAARESARRTECSTQINDLLLAISGYEMAFEHFPAGTRSNQGPIENLPNGQHINWIAHVLPYMGEPTRYAQLDLSLSAYHHKNNRVRQTSIEMLKCPSDPSAARGTSNYAGCHHDLEAPIQEDNHGVFFLNSRLTRDDISDGLGYTLFLGEKTIEDTDLGWLSGTPATLRNTGSPLGLKPVYAGGNLTWWDDGSLSDVILWNERTSETDDNSDGDTPDSPEKSIASNSNAPDENGLLPLSREGGNRDSPLAVGGFSSYHQMGSNFAFGDGSVRFIANDASPSFLKRIGHRADGQIVDASEW